MFMFNSRSGIKYIQLTGLVHALKNTALNLIRYMCRNNCEQFKGFVHFLDRAWRKEFPNRMQRSGYVCLQLYRVGQTFISK